jgi:hypothetical protein
MTGLLEMVAVWLIILAWGLLRVAIQKYHARKEAKK